jgi:hypothetical protein
METKVIGAGLERAELAIPPLNSLPALILDVTKIREGESRLHESQVVNPGTYSELEYTYGEGYREAKKHLSVIYYQITMAEKAMDDAHSVAIMDEYPEYLTKTGKKDSTALQKAFLARYQPYVEAKDRVSMLKAMEKLMEGKVKVFENTCRAMKKTMDLILRSGVDPNKYGR